MYLRLNRIFGEDVRKLHAIYFFMSVECQRLCRRAGAYDHGQCCFESDVMECGDAASCQGEGIDAPNQAAIHGRGGQSPGLLVKHSASGTGSPRLEESSTEITVANPNLIEHADALSHGKDAACSPVQSDSNLDAAPGAPETLLSFRPTYYCYRTNSNTSISNNILRQIEDDDSMAGDFNCHHFLDNDSRQRWNLQVRLLIMYEDHIFSGLIFSYPI